MADNLNDTEFGRYYVYELVGADGGCSYIGKGTGRRFHVQCKKHGLTGSIVKRFKSESAAYKYEIKLISERKPLLNKHPGGNGSKAAIVRKTKFELLIERIGSRAYAARLLLRFGGFDPSKLEIIRQVAYGCR